MSAADAIVCHGGPATIVEARDAGHLPIVVPRRASLGEHVDDHQVRFAALVCGLGRVLFPRSERELIGLLERGMEAPDALAVEPDGSHVNATVRLLGDLIDSLFT
jgi:UDP-N-acetylglucosamine transferase subunit ALG13